MKEDGKIVGANWQEKLRKITKGWQLSVLWKDGWMSWVPLNELKNLNLVEVAEYAVANRIRGQRPPCRQQRKRRSGRWTWAALRPYAAPSTLPWPTLLGRTILDTMDKEDFSNQRLGMAFRSGAPLPLSEPIRWKDGTTLDVVLKDLKESNPIELAEYTINRIDNEPAFAL